MKKLAVFLVGASLMASIAVAANIATSVNTVGFEKFTVSTGQLALVRCDFLDVGSPMIVSNVFGSTLPLGTKLYFWNGATYQIEQYTKILISPPSNYRTNWAPGTNQLVTGDAFWISLPASAEQGNYDVVISGEVPGASRQPSNTVGILPGLNLVGYSYPAEIAWTNTTMSSQAVLNDRLYLWTGSNYNIYAYSKVLISPPNNYTTNWGDATSVILKPGQGFWYSRDASATPFNWTEILPYIVQ